MKIQGSINVTMDVCPIHVMKCLLETELNHLHWVTEENGEYYIVREEYKFTESKEKITKERYDYINSIQHIIDVLSERQEKKNIKY